MGRSRWDHPDEFDHAVVVATADERRQRDLVEALARARGQERARALGRYPRYRVVAVAKPGELLRRAGASVSAAAVDIALPGGNGLATIRRLREGRPTLAILAFGVSTVPSDAIAAVMSGADFFHECTDDAGARGFARAVELAIDRRRLTHTIERNEAEVEAARGRLAQLSGELVRAVPSFRSLKAREDVLPFREAARRYLLDAAQLFSGDARGLARALGVSYFALRRLLARYEVPFPAARGRRGPRGVA